MLMYIVLDLRSDDYIVEICKGIYLSIRVGIGESHIRTLVRVP